MNRKLGEQWIENGRMYKVVEGINCSGCCYNEGDQGCYISGIGCPTDNGETDLVVKDLGPVNEDGCLAEERTGLFPTITKVTAGIWKASVYQNGGLMQIEIEVWATRQQQVIDAWNRRAM